MASLSGSGFRFGTTPLQCAPEGVITDYHGLTNNSLLAYNINYSYMLGSIS